MLRNLWFPFFCFLTLCVTSFAEEDYTPIKPTAIFTDADAFPSQTGEYVVENSIDSNPETYCCLLDTTRDGKQTETNPPQAAAPVTGRLTLDFGKPVELSGLALTSRHSSGSFLPRLVNVLSCVASEMVADSGLEILNSKSVPVTTNGNTTFFLFPKPITSRYFRIDVLDSCECGPTHYNFQIAEIAGFKGLPKGVAFPNAPELAFPEERLLRDWLYQDYGLDTAACFASSENASLELQLIEKVLTELKDNSEKIDVYTNERDRLTSLNLPGSDPQWRELYHKMCIHRRQLRLQPLLAETRQIIYTKHCLLSGPVHYAWTDEVTDQQYTERIADFRPGAQLCRLTLNEDGTARNEILLQKPDGMIRDPNLSWDASEVVFSARENYTDDDFHLYIMNLNDLSVRQVTSGKAVSDVEPAFLPNGDLVFQSTRCVQLTDCWRQTVSNIYTCTADGKKLHRLCFDQVHTNYPQILDDGRVLYTRWEYNDRGQIYPQPLFTMNPDGSAQTALYGENSWFPTSILHARGVPGSAKVVGIASGHHVHQRGKLILVDRSRGTQGNDGIEFLAPRRKSEIPPISQYRWDYDAFGQDGEQFQYPFALDEENFLVTYSPEGYIMPGGNKNNVIYDPPFGVYWMADDGRRELLAWDPTTSCNQQIAVLARPVPPCKPSSVDGQKSRGSFFLQDVYIGEPMKGVNRGEAKRIRVVGVEYRAADVLYNSNTGEAGPSHSRTPISINNGSWDVKHVLGEVEIEEDGSAFFEVPARTPLYFQVLDAKGLVLATMRSWSTLQPGETFACIGCHEDKLETYTTDGTKSLAMKKPVQTLQPSPGSLSDPYRFGSTDSVASYLGINRAKGQSGPFDGFSYPREIQPIWDAHCVSCHDGNEHDGQQIPLNLSGKIGEYTWDQCPNNGDATQNALRDFSVSYLELTNYGHGSPLVNWISAQSRPTLLPSRFAGSARSQLMNYLDGSHYDVKLSDREQRLVACWIDLCVPFCGSYTEANQWSDEQKKTYDYFEQKREHWAGEELKAMKETP
ncbi:MAG: hypothetical protein Q4G68_12255 [Planctomycetia bacterium]|nr:hypothetical protein [Planctomycetia bacterium]